MTTKNTILGFGASSMQGARDSGGGFLKRLEQALNKDTHTVDAVNLGIGGDTTREMLGRIGSVEKHKPACTIVLLGCNDMPRLGDRDPSRRTSLQEYENNLKVIFPKLRAKRSIFITSFYVNEIQEEVFFHYMEAARKLAVGYEVWDMLRDSRPLLPRYLADDFAHFNDEGHQYICDHLLRMLSR